MLANCDKKRRRMGQLFGSEEPVGIFKLNSAKKKMLVSVVSGGKIPEVLVNIT